MPTTVQRVCLTSRLTTRNKKPGQSQKEKSRIDSMRWQLPMLEKSVENYLVMVQKALRAGPTVLQTEQDTQMVGRPKYSRNYIRCNFSLLAIFCSIFISSYFLVPKTLIMVYVLILFPHAIFYLWSRHDLIPTRGMYFYSRGYGVHIVYSGVVFFSLIVRVLHILPVQYRDGDL